MYSRHNNGRDVSASLGESAMLSRFFQGGYPRRVDWSSFLGNLRPISRHNNGRDVSASLGESAMLSPLFQGGIRGVVIGAPSWEIYDLSPAITTVVMYLRPLANPRCCLPFLEGVSAACDWSSFLGNLRCIPAITTAVMSLLPWKNRDVTPPLAKGGQGGFAYQWTTEVSVEELMSTIERGQKMHLKAPAMQTPPRWSHASPPSRSPPSAPRIRAPAPPPTAETRRRSCDHRESIGPRLRLRSPRWPAFPAARFRVGRRRARGKGSSARS